MIWEQGNSHRYGDMQGLSLIDDFQLNPGFLKIDVEGYEFSVIKGASKALHKHRPVVLAEVCDYMLRANSSSSEALFELMESYGYNFKVPKRKDNKFVKTSSNILFLPN